MAVQSSCSFFKLGGFLKRGLRALYIFWIEAFSQIRAWIDFLPVCLPFHLFLVFKKQNFTILMKSSLLVFLLRTVPFLRRLRNPGLTRGLKDGLVYFCYKFYSCRFLRLESMNHAEFIFIYGTVNSLYIAHNLAIWKFPNEPCCVSSLSFRGPCTLDHHSSLCPPPACGGDASSTPSVPRSVVTKYWNLGLVSLPITVLSGP